MSPVAVIALARRHRKSRNQFFVPDPVTGQQIALNPPKGTVSGKDLWTAMDSAKDDRGQAVLALVHPFRLDGPNPRPDLVRVVFKALRIAVAKAEAESAA